MKRLILLAGLLAIGGCSSTSFVGKRFDNFTAYYNTFYNAKKSYGEAVKAMDRPDQAIDRTTYLFVFDPGTRGSGTKDFENAIKKSADVLRGHPDSKWVDDALLLIGKSYYHMGNTVGAQQKFREVIDRPSDLENEARFWLGLSLMASGSLDEAAAHLQSSLEREKVPRKWASRMRLALGELYVRQERWSEAAEELDAGAERVGDDELGSRAQFLLGQVLETLGEYDRAVRAYRRVSDFNPRYELSYAAKFNAVRVEGEHLDADAALQEVRKMERDDKNFAYRGELLYLRGRILKASGRAEEALFTFYDVLYDTDANITAIRGPAHYHLGLLFRDQLNDFDIAAAHFDTAATSLGRGNRSNTSGRDESLARASYAITDAGELAEVFGRFAEFHAEVNHYDSLLALGTLDEESFRQRIEEIRLQRAEEMVEERRSQERRAAEAGFRGTGVTETGRTTSSQGQADYSTAGFLYHRDRSRVQEGLLSFFDRWGERPHVPNWRRSAAITGAQATASAGEEDAAETPNQLTQPVSGNVSAEALMSSVDLDLSAIPRTPERQAEMRHARAEAGYELANVLFLSIGMPDSAAAWYRQVLDEADDPEVRARALYALAEVQLSLGDRESSSAIYRQVLSDHPESEVAARAAQRLGIEEPGVETDDREQLTKWYQSAFDEWVSGSFTDAMRHMLGLAATYPDSLVSGRALLAASAIYVDWAEAAGKDVLDPIAVQVPDSLWLRLGLIEDRDSTATVTPVDPVPLDSAAAVPMSDSLAASAALDVAPGRDTLGLAPADSVDIERMKADSVVADSPVADSLVADSLVAVAATVADSLGREPARDSLRVTARAVPDTARVHLLDIYRLVSRRYPGSTYATRASELARVIELRMAPPPDSSDVELPADSMAAAPVAPETAADVAARQEPGVTPDTTLVDAPGGRKRVLEEDQPLDAQTGRPPALRDEALSARDAVASDTTVYESADTEPALVGGEGALERMFRYPDSAAEAGVTGKVVVRFVVDQRGRVVDPAVADSVGSGCDEEALRVIRLARFRPALIDRRPVRLQTSIEIECAPGTSP